MTDQIDTLMVDVRASTEGFARDIAEMRSSVDSNLIDGFTRAGDVLERGLSGAIRKGSLGFDDLKRAAMSALDEIAAQSLKGLFAGLSGGSSGGGLLDLGGIVSSVLGLPGRATGGLVAPEHGYLVGERGPELFVPTSAGRIEPLTAPSGGTRDVRVAINVTSPRGASTPQSLQRSSRQVAGAVRRAIAFN